MDNIEVYLETGQDAIRECVYSVLEQDSGIDIIDGFHISNPQFGSFDDETLAVLILDISLYRDKWVDIILRLREKLPSIAILLISDSDNDDLRYTALKSGADAFLAYDRLTQKLNKTIEELSYGYLPVIRVLLRPDVASLALDEFHDFSVAKDEPTRPDIRLTFQQRTILQYIENRHAVPQLVSSLGISQGRVIEQLETIREKLMDIDEYLRPAPEPVFLPEAEEGTEEIEVPEEEEDKEPQVTNKTRNSPFRASLSFLNGITPLITTYPWKLYRGIFRPTVSKVIVLFIVMVIGFFLSIHLLPGHDMYVVSSESMEPSISMGDIIVTKELDEESIGHLAPGDIITFEHGKNTVTHRLLSINGDTLTTKGDAAEESDPWSITLSEVKDVYLFRIPLVGYIPQLAKEKIGWFLMIVFPAVVLVGLLVKDIIKEAFRKDEPVTEKQGGGVI